jgi:signal transduction histidine kinase
MDRFVTVTQGEVFYITEVLAALEGMERGPAGNTSLAAAFVLAQTMERLSRTAKEKGVLVELETGYPVMALADPDLLDRVAWNLIHNAIKFTPSGGNVRVRVGEEGGFATIEVLDTGPGIPEDRIDQIFERFVRLDDSRTPGEREGGTGLGLAIVRAISDLHGGRVEAWNRREGGAAFRVCLPLMKEPS